MLSGMSKVLNVGPEIDTGGERRLDIEPARTWGFDTSGWDLITRFTVGFCSRRWILLFNTLTTLGPGPPVPDILDIP